MDDKQIFFKKYIFVQSNEHACNVHDEPDHIEHSLEKLDEQIVDNSRRV
jgi:hypothetical protein